MVNQERVGMIVTLVHQIPGDCTLYFPDQVGSTVTYGEMSVTLNALERSNYVVQRNFSVGDARTNTGIDVAHYHFTGW